MKIIAFKRAGANQSHLHPEFIVEYIDADLLASKEGYETMVEEHFQLELAKNDERHKSHLNHIADQAKKAEAAAQAAALALTVEEKQDMREYNRFKAWQRHQGKK